MAGIDIRIKAAQIALQGWKAEEKKAGHIPSSEEKMVKWNELFGKIDEYASKAKNGHMDSYALAAKLFPSEARAYQHSRTRIITVGQWKVRDAQLADIPHNDIRVTVGRWKVRDAQIADVFVDAIETLLSYTAKRTLTDLISAALNVYSPKVAIL